MRCFRQQGIESVCYEPGAKAFPLTTPVVIPENRREGHPGGAAIARRSNHADPKIAGAMHPVFPMPP